jgi:glutamine amidotransferase
LHNIKKENGDMPKLLNRQSVCIIDYGSGNVGSVHSVLRQISDSVIVSNSPSDIGDATHIVLPGVGAFGAAMKKIRELNLIGILEKNVIEKGKPFLGICIGMQILADKGLEHGSHEGFGWIPGVVKKMEVGDLLLPHVGWNDIIITNPCTVLGNLGDSLDFYFVHSYHFDAASTENVNALFEYGSRFTAVVSKENIVGVQFHPEKSQNPGRLFLTNFLKLQ